jgi:hypothetical protein
VFYVFSILGKYVLYGDDFTLTSWWTKETLVYENILSKCQVIINQKSSRKSNFPVSKSADKKKIKKSLVRTPMIPRSTKLCKAISVK